MSYLLDTNTLYWWVFFPELLTARVRAILADPDTKAYASAVSAYEMSYKHHRGRWPEVEPLVSAFEEVVAAERFGLLPLTARHAARAGAYPVEHRDPFDRMMAAQAEAEDLALVTNDRWIAELVVRVVW